MQLTSFFKFLKYALKSVLIVLLLVSVDSRNFVMAEPLTYSPDQWPRHWNVLLNKTHLQNRLNGYRANARYTNKTPLRSPVWGVVPAAKQKSRRSFRPEYNTNAHMRNYYSNNFYQGNYYSGFAGYGLSNPHNSPLLVPGVTPGLMPGFASPGIPFATYPYAGDFPGRNYSW